MTLPTNPFSPQHQAEHENMETSAPTKMDARKVEDRSQPHTRLVDKHHSPMVIRKFTKYGFPIYVGLITDDDLSTMDANILGYLEAHKHIGWVENIQMLRDLAGGLTEHLTEVYLHTEGVGVVFYVDKCFISSLYGDLMTHHACKTEFFALLGMSIGV
jgi:hypothetical protein